MGLIKVSKEPVQEPERRKIKMPVTDFTDFDEQEFKKFTVPEMTMILITVALLILAVVEFINFLQ